VTNDRGIDYDLQACLECNPQHFSVTDILRVLAVHEGENDGESWRWVLQLHAAPEDYMPDDYVGPFYVFLTGSCDYTGWECQSSADAHYFADLPMLFAWAATNGEPPEIMDELWVQVDRGQANVTWRARMDYEFDLARADLARAGIRTQNWEPAPIPRIVLVYHWAWIELEP
jgi:hypothetical protein